jgi:hypothetical protein
VRPTSAGEMTGLAITQLGEEAYLHADTRC